MKALCNGSKEHDEFKFSRILYYIESLFEYFISILVSGAYLAKLTTTIGISDEITAILSSLTALSGIFQIFSIYLSHKTPVKGFLIPMLAIPQLLFAGVYMIPLLNINLSVASVFFVAMFVAHAISSVASPIKANWFISLVEPAKRGQFSATNAIISSVGSMAFIYVASSLIDNFEAAGNMNGAYLTFSITILVIAALRVLALILAKEKQTAPSVQAKTPFASVGEILRNKGYMRVVALFTLFGIASAATTPFLGTYQISELGFTMTFISVVDIIMSILTILATYLFGKYSTHVSYASLVRISHIFFVFAFGFIMFSTPAVGVFTFVGYRIMLLVGNAMRTASTSALFFEVTSPENRVTALAINTIITGITSFLTTLVLTPFVTYIQKSGNQIFGIQVYAQQILAFLSVVIFVIVIFYYRFFCKNILENRNQNI